MVRGKKCKPASALLHPQQDPVSLPLKKENALLTTARTRAAPRQEGLWQKTFLKQTPPFRGCWHCHAEEHLHSSTPQHRWRSPALTSQRQASPQRSAPAANQSEWCRGWLPRSPHPTQGEGSTLQTSTRGTQWNYHVGTRQGLEEQAESKTSSESEET